MFKYCILNGKAYHVFIREEGKGHWTENYTDPKVYKHVLLFYGLETQVYFDLLIELYKEREGKLGCLLH